MKYCPYCGAEFLNSSVSFCAECGKAVDNIKRKKPEKRKKKHYTAKKVPDEPPENASEPETQIDLDFGYDGYYDDVLPTDDVVERQQIDKETVKNLIIIAVGVFVAITICVVAMYLM